MDDATRLARLVRVTRDLARDCDRLSFGPPVTHVLDPLRYARAPFLRYLARWGGRRPEVILLGMNPGPFGMAQTGVPFGDAGVVRDWLGVEAPVARPAREHPRRPVLGFACLRGEVSGRRLWGWARERFGTPERFLARFLILNYCPLLFLEETGRNRTPDKLPAAEREPLFAACDLALRRAVEALAPERVIGVGAFAEGRAHAALEGLPAAIGGALHPSPASPAANRGWAAQWERQLAGQGVVLPPRARARR
jgi:single-strand selective monofunctional uracil DNA glycosylase